MIYILKSEYHHRSVAVRAAAAVVDNHGAHIVLRPAQVHKVWGVLCGDLSCKCGDALGCSGPQRTDQGQVLVVDIVG